MADAPRIALAPVSHERAAIEQLRSAIGDRVGAEPSSGMGGLIADKRAAEQQEMFGS